MIANNNTRSTVLCVGLLFLLILAPPITPSSSKFGSFVEAVEFIRADNAVVADTEQIFSIQYSSTTVMKDDGGWACSGNAVAFIGYLPNETYPIKVFEGSVDDDTLSCAEQSICLVDSNSNLCIDMNTTKEVTEGSFSVKNENEVYWYDFAASISGICIPADWYPACDREYVPLSVLKSDPEQYLSNNNPDDLEQMTPYYYIAYYTDSDCGDLTGIISGISGEDITIPTMDESFTCSEATVCAIDSNSEACKAIDPTLLTNINNRTNVLNILVNDDGTIQEYDPSNVNIGEDINVKHSQTACGKSSILANCYYQEFSGITLAQNPKYLIGDFTSTTTSNDDDDGIDDETENETETETETEPKEYNDHGIDGHNHDTDHSFPDYDETVELPPTTMEDSAATTATGGSAHFVVLVAVAVSIVITASSSLVY